MIEHITTNVGDHAFAKPGHKIKTGVGRSRHDDDDREQRQQRLIERRGICLNKALVDNALEPLADDEETRRRHEQRACRSEHLATVGARIADQKPQLAKGGE